MDSWSDENFILKKYREYMAGELSRPEAKAGKKKLAAFFEAPEPSPVFSFLTAGFFVPALLLAGTFFFLYQMQSRMPVVAGPAKPLYSMFAGIMEETPAREAAAKTPAVSKSTGTPANAIPAAEPKRKSRKPRVEVKRITSTVGPTMVYQRVYRKIPVTIIWVFTPSQNAAF